jgi:hypothetical protein
MGRGWRVSDGAQTGLDWTGLDWTGLDWTGLDWTGLDWTGLDWTGAWREVGIHEWVFCFTHIECQ